MKQILELNKKDIADILAEKYGVTPEKVTVDIIYEKGDRPFESDYKDVKVTIVL